MIALMMGEGLLLSLPVLPTTYPQSPEPLRTDGI